MAVSNFARNQTIPVPHATAKTTLIVPPQPPPRNAPSPPQPKPIRKAAIAWTDRTLKAYEDSPVSTSISAPASRSTSTSKSTSTSTPVSAPPTSMRSVRKEKNTVPAIAGTVNQMATGPKNSSCIRLPSRGVAVTGGYAEAVIRLQSHHVSRPPREPQPTLGSPAASLSSRGIPTGLQGRTQCDAASLSEGTVI